MLSSSSRLSFSKLKFLSRLLDCSVLVLKCNGSLRHFSERLYTQRRNSVLSDSYVRRFFSSENTLESPYGNVNYDAIAKGDEELLKKLKVIILEAEVMRQEGLRVPSIMSEERWEELLSATSRAKRLKLLAFWWLNEKKRESQKKKKEEARLKREKELEENDKRTNGHISYGFGGSTIFLRIYDSHIDNFHNHKLIKAMIFGQNLIIDCSYDEHMNKKEASLCATQLKVVFSENRLQEDPFNIHFCNVNKSGQLFSKFHKNVPTLYEPAFPANIAEKSYLELFPKEQLVYLTPHCREELREFNHDDIYIVGAMVDKSNNDPLSLGKAKAQGLRMARLPLDRYLDWGIGCKSLTLNQMLMILHELKRSGNWHKALEHVPRRKIKGEYFDKKFGSSPRKQVISLSKILSV